MGEGGTERKEGARTGQERWERGRRVGVWAGGPQPTTPIPSAPHLRKEETYSREYLRRRFLFYDCAMPPHPLSGALTCTKRVGSTYSAVGTLVGSPSLSTASLNSLASAAAVA